MKQVIGVEADFGSLANIFQGESFCILCKAFKSNCGLFVEEFEWFYKTVPKNGIVCASRLQTRNHDVCSIVFFSNCGADVAEWKVQELPKREARIYV